MSHSVAAPLRFQPLLPVLVLLLCNGINYGANRIAVLGDSSSDEYAFSQLTEARSWVELLAENRDLDFGEFQNEAREDSRQNGYSFNWSRGGASATGQRDNWDLSSQTKGLLSQLSSEQIDVVYVGLGGNDFGFVPNLSQFFPIHNETLTEAEAEQFSDYVVDQIRDTVHAIYASGVSQIVIENIEDVPLYPSVMPFTTPEGGERVRRVIRSVNSRLNSLADELAIPIIDNYSLTRLAQEQSINIANMSLNSAESHPTGTFRDGLHFGTVASGLYANTFLHAIEGFGIQVSSFSDQDLLHFRSQDTGLEGPPDPATVSFFDVTGFVTFDDTVDIGGRNGIGQLGWHPKNNLAKHGHASHSPDGNIASADAARAIDEDHNTTSRTKRSIVEQRWELDLGGSRQLTHATIYGLSDRSNHLTSGSGISVSVLGDDGDVVWEQDFQGDFWGPLQIEFASFGESVSGQTFRLRKLDPISLRESSLQLREVELFGPEGTTVNYSFRPAQTLSFEIDPIRQTADRIIASGTLALNDVQLQVMSLGGPLHSGDEFQLFDAKKIDGTFSQLTLPKLSPNLVWDVSKLLSRGTIQVVPEANGVASWIPVILTVLCRRLGLRPGNGVTASRRFVKQLEPKRPFTLSGFVLWEVPLPVTCRNLLQAHKTT